MKRCVCCNKPTTEWLTILTEKKVVNFHLSKDMERQEYEGDRRFYVLDVCFTCQEQVRRGKAIKEIKYSLLLHEGAMRPFSA